MTEILQLRGFHFLAFTEIKGDLMKLLIKWFKTFLTYERPYLDFVYVTQKALKS